ADKMNDKMETDRFMYTDKFSIKIYNRWGKLVFESEDYKKEWDCNDSGAGTYYFHATFTNTCYPDKEPVESKGYVQVLK
ncbi:MAG: gliding motility-associated C-terminal domain-containing protein, partial [Bacteroidetes bacterium]|nr:gliding motility-associated C-terminal domain-containing protein [Bacteroidota bacterium]